MDTLMHQEQRLTPEQFRAGEPVATETAASAAMALWRYWKTLRCTLAQMESMAKREQQAAALRWD